MREHGESLLKPLQVFNSRLVLPQHGGVENGGFAGLRQEMTWGELASVNVTRPERVRGDLLPPLMTGGVGWETVR